MLIAVAMAEAGINEYIIWVVTLTISVFAFSSPILFINHRVAVLYSLGAKKKVNVRALTTYNHLVTFFVYLAIYIILMNM
jgi:hypothetical protein